ncbi:ribonuclease HII [Arthrobacter sp. Y-9]|uniref:ribonuclease HII n=1 Tax=Arthrobacter sp. Y-9 TaxID=3039385 RepID=UPI00241FD058|nr:ribonuclease HII [Arthrobacter sp. Y-9]WFR82895.1 ribonuclease HII [Arthrobacter sp. Y-9]
MAAPTLDMERSLAGPSVRYLACLDEVGRGALAGPVSVGLTVLDLTALVELPDVRDSKLLKAARREELAPVVREWAAFCAVGHATAAEIDALGIVEALALAAQRAWHGVVAAGGRADAVLLDGKHNWLQRPEESLFDLFAPASAAPVTAGFAAVVASAVDIRDIPVTMRIKADMDCQGVAAASILAKVERDAIMAELAVEHPAFGWDVNKGYGTATHKDAIRQLGPCDHHRRSWKLL